MPLLDRLLALAGLDFDLDLASDRLSEVGPGRFLGERPTPDDTAPLQALGITHVVSCLEAADRDRVAFLADTFTTCFVPVRDSMEEDLLSRLPEVLAFADTADGGLLVHCERGVSRSGTVALALHMRAHGGTFLEAFHAVRARRPGVLPNIGFAAQLQRHEQALLGPRPGPSSLATYLVEVCHVPAPVDDVDAVLADHDLDAPAALRALFGGAIPRVVQGVRR